MPAQNPTADARRLVAIDGGPRITGEDVLNAIGDLLADHLPGVPHDDPMRPALDALAGAAGISIARPLEVQR